MWSFSVNKDNSYAISLFSPLPLPCNKFMKHQFSTVLVISAIQDRKTSNEKIESALVLSVTFAWFGGASSIYAAGHLLAVGGQLREKSTIRR